MNERWETSAPTASPFVEHNCEVKLRDWKGRGGDRKWELGMGALPVVAVVLVVVGYTVEQQWLGEGMGRAGTIVDSGVLESMKQWRN